MHHSLSYIGLGASLGLVSYTLPNSAPLESLEVTRPGPPTEITGTCWGSEDYRIEILGQTAKLYPPEFATCLQRARGRGETSGGVHYTVQGMQSAQSIAH